MARVEWRMTRRAILTAGLATVTALGMGACTAAPNEPPPAGAALRLVAYDSCAEALTDLRRAAAPYVTPYGLNAPGDPGAVDVQADARQKGMAPAAPATPNQAPDHSGTNTHEADVDEPDLVKTDGRRIVTVVGGRLRVVDVATRRQSGDLDLRSAADPPGSVYSGQLLLSGDRALVFSADETGGGRIVADKIAPGPAETRLTLVDLSGAPRVVERFVVNGADYLDARQSGTVARVVVQTRPRLPFVQPGGAVTEKSALRTNQDVLRAAPISAWLPTWERRHAAGVERGTVPCERLSHPVRHTATSVLTVLTVDLAGDGFADGDPVSLSAAGDIVYATGGTLYVADNRWRTERPGVLRGGVTRPEVVEDVAEVYAFDTSRPGRPVYRAAGSVPGRLINQYALSDHAGHLRIATTRQTGARPTADAPADMPQPRPATVSAVTVLARDGERLVRVGRVDGLGRGEQIYSVRFAGDVGYVVTFRQTDPLYTLDLSDPRAPRLAGTLKIPGYSAYLHPVGDGRLIGVGQDADSSGRVRGLQVSVFDVRDLARPVRTAQFAIPTANSGAEYDPHAFLWWPKTGLLAVPVTRWTVDRPGEAPDQGRPDQGVLMLRLAGSALTERGILRDPPSRSSGQGYQPGPERTLVIGDTIWTVSQTGLAGYDLDTLGRHAFVALDR